MMYSFVVALLCASASLVYGVVAPMRANATPVVNVFTSTLRQVEGFVGLPSGVSDGVPVDGAVSWDRQAPGLAIRPDSGGLGYFFPPGGGLVVELSAAGHQWVGTGGEVLVVPPPAPNPVFMVLVTTRVGAVFPQFPGSGPGNGIGLTFTGPVVSSTDLPTGGINLGAATFYGGALFNYNAMPPGYVFSWYMRDSFTFLPDTVIVCPAACDLVAIPEPGGLALLGPMLVALGIVLYARARSTAGMP